jgi:hypothetical protein
MQSVQQRGAWAGLTRGAGAQVWDTHRLTKDVSFRSRLTYTGQVRRPGTLQHGRVGWPPIVLCCGDASRAPSRAAVHGAAGRVRLSEHLRFAPQREAPVQPGMRACRRRSLQHSPAGSLAQPAARTRARRGAYWRSRRARAAAASRPAAPTAACMCGAWSTPRAPAAPTATPASLVRPPSH